MTSVLTKYAERDNRLESVTLTGFITSNGGKTGSDQHPAYAEIDLTKSKNFSIDTRILTLRTDSPIYFLLRIYISSSKPPSYHQNFEFDIFITPPSGEQHIRIEVYPNKTNALIGAGRICAFSNEIPTLPGEYTEDSGVATFKILNNSVVLKSIPRDFS